MKRDRIIYWIATATLALILGFSGIMYFINPDMKGAFLHLGFPDYFRVELGIAKLIAVPLLLVPQVPRRLKEWVYVGVGIDFVSAAIAHASSNDPASSIITPIVLFGFLIVSYVYYHKINIRQTGIA
ncbi:MAG: DoxX family protein [Spirosoma sp.]|nr:DoxX family protein [Spirosoma sp.]